ncbi:MAG: chemotaxis protein CheW [Alphaproteobacteria bacterium]|nr:chemotaxis protein CheW [Alphaproteobacteria bacterium]
MSNTSEIDLVTMFVDGVQFGVPVLQVRDVLDSPATYPVPLAPPEIRGSINLRGRIVTAIDLRVRLGLPPRDTHLRSKCVIVELTATGEPYAFLVDEVGDVLRVSANDYEPNPITLSRAWSAICRGLYRRAEGLLLVMDAQAALSIDTERQAA